MRVGYITRIGHIEFWPRQPSWAATVKIALNNCVMDWAAACAHNCRTCIRHVR